MVRDRALRENQQIKTYHLACVRRTGLTELYPATVLLKLLVGVHHRDKVLHIVCECDGSECLLSVLAS